MTSPATIAGAAVGILVAGAESLRPSLTPRSTIHQSLVSTAMATTGAAAGALVGAAAGRLSGDAARNVWVLSAAAGGAAVATAALGRSLSTAARESHAEWGPTEGRPLLGASIGMAAAAAITAATLGAGQGAHRSGVAVSRRVGGPPGLWALTGAATVGGAAAVGITLAKRRALASLAEDGRKADAALVSAPDDPHVSGGPGSLVDYDTLSREGRRFVTWRVSARALVDAGFVAAGEPIRVFVGIDSAPDVESRVDLAMAEMERLGAFAKSHILVQSPAGSGYANSVPVEALEVFTAGDCASIVVQYGVLPSMFSLGEVPMASKTFRLLIDRIRERTAGLAPQERPRLYLYGESLGALVAQDALTTEPALVDPAAGTMTGADAAVFVGSPGGTPLRDALREHPRIVHVDQWRDLPQRAPVGCQFWFLDHDADPVTRFEADLLRRRPHWLRHDIRGRNIPDRMRWLPLLTWQQVMWDVAFATQAQSGVFRSLGHDYRADLAHVVAAAFAPQQQGQVEQVQALLVERELARDRRLQDAEAAVDTDA